MTSYHHHHLQITYKQAVAAAFIEGWVFLFLSVTGVRGHVVRLVPRPVMLATAGGIGLFLSFIGE
jgi:AGZA family xanthine/uracil permease-like MFS transporter